MAMKLLRPRLQLRTRCITGFSLIELLVVLAVIVLLSLIGVVVFSSMVRNARDQQRMRDLNVVKQALEMYRNDAGYYPAMDAPTGILEFVCPPEARSFSYSGKVYLERVPSDPACARGINYLYTFDRGACDGTHCPKFTLCAWKEGDNVLPFPSECSGPNCGNEPCGMGVTND